MTFGHKELSLRKIETRESLENGKNVEVVIRFLRHGERTPEGELTDYGRQETKSKGEKIANEENYDAVKAIGSPVGPLNDVSGRSFGRAAETAHIYANAIAGDKAFQTRINEFLGYEELHSIPPFDHDTLYNSHLPENFASLSDQDKASASKKAQEATLREELACTAPGAETFRREVAGAFAHVVNHYRHIARRLKNNSRVLIPAGTHGGIMEYLLMEAMVRIDDSGRQVVGVSDINEIGGGFNPSESYSVRIATDENGNEKELILTFDENNRSQDTFHLSLSKINELDEEYTRNYIHTLP